MEPKVQDAINKMIDLLEERYKAAAGWQSNAWFVVTHTGRDGGDIHTNGDYVYDDGCKVNFLKQSREEIINILDEYFEYDGKHFI